MKEPEDQDMKKYVVIADSGCGHSRKKVFGPFSSAWAGLQFSREKVAEISRTRDFVDGTGGEWNVRGGKELEEDLLPWHISAGMDSDQFLVLELSDPGMAPTENDFLKKDIEENVEIL